jgi:hypothetical protein
MPPIGDRPSLIASTFQPDVGELRRSSFSISLRAIPDPWA